MLNKYIIIIVALITSSVLAKDNNDFDYPLVYETYKVTRIISVEKDIQQITIKDNSGSKQRIYFYEDNKNKDFFNRDVKGLIINNKYHVKVIYTSEDDYNNDENGQIIAISKYSLNI